MRKNRPLHEAHGVRRTKISFFPPRLLFRIAPSIPPISVVCISHLHHVKCDTYVLVKCLTDCHSRDTLRAGAGIASSRRERLVYFVRAEKSGVGEGRDDEMRNRNSYSAASVRVKKGTE